MILTEEEAKTKWCPKQGSGLPANSGDGQACCCIASNCMAWRWAGIEEYRRANMGDTFHGDEPHIPMEQHPLSNRPYLQANHKGRFALTPRGFCGLAGKADL